MSDTRKILRQSDAHTKGAHLQPLERKPVAREIWPSTQNEILYRAAWRQDPPWKIAKDLSKGPVRLSAKQAYLVITAELRKLQPPSGPPAPVIRMPLKEAA